MNTTAVDAAVRVQYVDYAAPPEPGTFEIGLVMAGAVSAGAYTAGVVDFLIEALDAWEAAKRRCAAENQDSKRWPIPGHRVRIRVMSGASAGAMTSVIAAVALHYDFPHVRDAASGQTSPLYRPWVKEIDISKLLTTHDLSASAAPVLSALDSSVLQEILSGALDFEGSQAPPRLYLEPSVRVIVTEGNLRGIPYFLAMRGNTLNGLGMISHSDYQSFCVPYGVNAVGTARPDDTILSSQNGSNDSRWSAFGLAALASGAFPIGLAPRMVERDAREFNYRYVVVPGDGNRPAEVVDLQPQWTISGRRPAPFRSFIVDGGTMNNDPLELARAELAGRLGRNPRTGRLATRATILIDPFPDSAGSIDDPTRGQQNDVLHAAIGLMEAWKDQARYDPVDLALAADDTSYSRFLVAPDRGTSPESHDFALACGALGGFSGFLSESYRHHDYMLGRRNCQQFLREHFCLPIDNDPVFGVINPSLRQPGSPWLAPGAGPPSLAIIPLMPSTFSGSRDLTVPEPLPNWPKLAFNPDSLRDPAGTRLAAVVDHILRNSVHLNWFFQLIAKLGLMRIRSAAIDKIVTIVREQLAQRGLV